MSRTTVKSHARKGTRGVKRHSRAVPDKKRVPHNPNPQLRDYKKRKRELLKQQQDIIDFIELDTKKEGKKFSYYDYKFERDLIESYDKIITVTDPHRGWEEEKRITTRIDGEKISYRGEPENWKYKHKLTIRVNNPHITRGYRQKTKSFKTLLGFKKFYQDFTYIDV